MRPYDDVSVFLHDYHYLERMSLWDTYVPMESLRHEHTGNLSINRNKILHNLEHHHDMTKAIMDMVHRFCMEDGMVSTDTHDPSYVHLDVRHEYFKRIIYWSSSIFKLDMDDYEPEHVLMKSLLKDVRDVRISRFDVFHISLQEYIAYTDFFIDTYRGKDTISAMMRNIVFQGYGNNVNLCGFYIVQGMHQGKSIKDAFMWYVMNVIGGNNPHRHTMDIPMLSCDALMIWNQVPGIAHTLITQHEHDENIGYDDSYFYADNEDTMSRLQEVLNHAYVDMSNAGRTIDVNLAASVFIMDTDRGRMPPLRPYEHSIAGFSERLVHDNMRRFCHIYDNDIAITGILELWHHMMFTGDDRIIYTLMVMESMQRDVDVSIDDIGNVMRFIGDISEGLPYEYALETMRINELS